MTAEFLPPVDNSHAGGDAFQLIGPVHRRIPSPGDQHMLAAERFHFLHRIVQVGYFVAVCAFDFQLSHLQNTIADR
ncbi:hypothetical protein D3C75_1241250 [compost metagenome]